MTKTICIVPARKGSKRFPGKNRKLLGGKLMLDYTIKVALKCEFIDEIIFISDDEYLLAQVDKKYKITVIQEPTELAQDDSQAWEVVKCVVECLELQLKNPNIIYLQPTSPFMTYENLSEAWQLYDNDYESVTTVCYEHLWKYKLNGAIYITRYVDVINCESLWRQAEHLMVMSLMNSLHIDTERDWNNANIYLQRKAEKIQKKEKKID